MTFNKLFVYGTLRKGEVRSYDLKNLELLKTIKVPGKLYKTDFDYPAAVFDPNSSNFIHGELYNLTTEDLKKIDKVEMIDEGFFIRSNITYNSESFYIYEPGRKLKKYINNKNLIKNGNWLTESGLALDRPEIFAKNFEDIHKSYYDKSSNDKSDSVIFLEGRNPFLITCPHSTKHKRVNKLKTHELYTAAIGTILHSKLDCSLLYSNRIQDTDPNYYDSSYFKTRLENILNQNNFKFVLDIHGTGEYRKFDIYPGVGINKEFLINNNYILDSLMNKAEKFNISVGGLDVFPAAKQQTITKFSARRFNITSMQLEIKKDLRTPENKPEFLNLINLLSEFSKEILD